MSFRVTRSMLAIGLVLGCVLAPAAAQEQEAAKPQASLWSVLNLPTLDRLTKPIRPKPKPPAVVSADKAKTSAAIRASTTPEYRARRAASAKEYWSNPETKNRRVAAMNTPEAKAKHKAAIKESLDRRKAEKAMAAIAGK